MKYVYIGINFLERFNNGKFLFYAIEIIVFILRLRKVKFTDVEKLSSIKKKILNIRLRLGYKINFLNLNLINAYKFRLFHFACIATGIIKGNSESSKKYLSIIGNSEFLEFLDLEHELTTCIKNIKKNNPISYYFHSKEKKLIGRSIFIGPSIDVDSVDLENYDTLIFIKPPRTNRLPKNKTIIVFLNNSWIKKEIDSVHNWINNYPHTKFISPQNIESAGLSKEKFLENLFVAPYGASPMGLQRSLLFIKNKYDFEKLNVIGFNLSLSKKPYHESYPSIIETLGDQKDIILWSNSVHDFFYNFYLTKSLLINDSRVESNLLDIVIKTPAMINELFLESFKQSI